jgi:agmatine deiminase
MKAYVRIKVVVAAAGTLAGASSVSAQVMGRDGRLIYPPGMDVPRSMSPLEREWLKRNPNWHLGGADLPTAPPSGPVHCAAEYEPMDGIIIAWKGSTTLNAIQAQMAQHITTTGNADLYVIVDNATAQATANTTLTNAGANMSRVKFMTKFLDSIWCRDYGPRYIWEGDCRAVVNHKYNRPTRVNDDTLPAFFAQQKKHAFYELGLNGTTLVHGGGNYHLDALGRGYATRLINNENPWFTEPQIVSIWQTYQNLNTVLFQPFPTNIDATQHIDMWMQVIADDKVIISEWPNNPGSTQAVICDNAAATMQSLGFTVFRTPAFAISGVHYTYTNMVMCNDIVMVPSYTHATVAPHNAAAVSVLQGALPGKQIIQIPCQNIIGLAGAIHCIVMHVPTHRGEPGPKGGLAPTAYLKAPNGGETVVPGEMVTISWISDDDEGVSGVDLYLSTDGGATFPALIGSGSALGSFSWQAPQVNTSMARIRVVAKDARGNTGFDDSDANFTIGQPCYANCDGSTAAPILNVADFTCFLSKFAAQDPYANCDGSTEPPVLNVADFTCFLSKFAAGCP